MTILALHSLSAIRAKSGLTKRNIADLTAAANRKHGPITIDRLRELENGPIRAEPWLDEATDLARILLLPGVVSMMWDEKAGVDAQAQITSGDLTRFDLGHEMPDEVDMLLRGVRLPLSMACRLAVRFGLTDPTQLEQLPIHQQIWATLEANERGAAPGECPWCRAPGGQHLPTCLPANIWSTRSTAPYATTTAPQPAKPGGRGLARMAKGLKAARKATQLTQAQVASSIGMHPNYLARIEQLKHPLSDAHAINIARILGCTVEDLFGASSED